MGAGRNNEESSEKLKADIVKYAGVGALVAAFALAMYFFQFHGTLSINQGDWGTFGDYFGGILGPILSFAALIILIITLHYQRRELQEARTQARIERLLKFADRVYAELEKLLDYELQLEVRPEVVVFYRDAGYARDAMRPLTSDDFRSRPPRHLFNFFSSEFPDSVAHRWELEQVEFVNELSWWDRFESMNLGKMRLLIKELDFLVNEIKTESGTDEAVMFYINRCQSVTKVFAIKEYMSPDKMSAICPFDIIAKSTPAGALVWNKVDGKFVLGTPNE